MSTLGRMVVFIWLFVVLIINSSYTASLTSILTVQQLQSPISGIQSLITGNEVIGFQEGSYVEDHLVKELNIPKSRLVALGSPEEYDEKLLSGAVAAIVGERPYVDLFLSNHCSFQIVGQEFKKSGMGFVRIYLYSPYLKFDVIWCMLCNFELVHVMWFVLSFFYQAFPRDSELAVDMSTAILTLTETGELQKIHDHWLNKRACGPQSSSEESEQLQLERFWGLFLIFSVLCVVALLIHLYRTLEKFRKHHPKVKKPRPKGYRLMRLQRFLSFMDKKHVVSENKLKRKRTTSGNNGGDEHC